MNKKGSKQTRSRGDDNRTAILAYLTLIGFVVAVILNMNRMTPLGSYHLRQMMGLMVLAIGVSLIPIIKFFVWALVLGLCGFGIINAAKKEMKPVPLVGQYFEVWFKEAFA